MNASTRLALVLTCTVAGCSANAKTQETQAPPAIEIARARAPVSAAIYRGPGSVRAAHTYRLAFEIAGRVSGAYADVGDRVGAGQILAQLDAADYRAQLDAARARSAQAHAESARAENGARPQERDQTTQQAIVANEGVARARAALDLAMANDRRMQTLAQSGDIAQQTADTTRAALRDAQAQYDAALAQRSSALASVSLVRVGTRNEDRIAALADARASDAGVALAAATLAKARLVAPAQSYVVERAIETGDTAEPGTLAFVLVDAAAPDVTIALPELRASEIAIGTPAHIELDGRSYAARVTRIEPAADAATRTLDVRLHVADFHAAPGAVVSVALGERSSGDASVPYGALVQDPRGTYVVRYDRARETVEHVPVSVRDSDGQVANVRGIRTGDAIVTLGQQEAVVGKPVRVVHPS